MTNHLGKRFKEIRETVGFNQSQVAKYLGVDQSYISKFEHGEREFSMDLLTKAANLFGCPVEALVDPESEFSPLPMAMRASDIQEEDLEVIATMNKLALNLRFMEGLLKGAKQR